MAAGSVGLEEAQEAQGTGDIKHQSGRWPNRRDRVRGRHGWSVSVSERGKQPPPWDEVRKMND